MTPLQFNRCLVSFLIIFSISLNPIFKINTVKVSIPEWKVQVGDVYTYVYTKIYDINSENPYKISSLVYNGSPVSGTGEWINIVYKKGLTMKIIITLLTPSIVSSKCNIVYNKSVILVEQSLQGLVRPTIDNQSYWKYICQNNENMTIMGDSIRYEWITDMTYENSNVTMLTINTWNWRTGWTSSYYLKRFNETTIIHEWEIKTMNNELFIPSNMIFGVLIFFLLVFALVITYKYKSRSAKNEV